MPDSLLKPAERFIFMQIKFIFSGKFLHEDSLWNRSARCIQRVRGRKATWIVLNSAVSSLYPEGGAGERRLNSESYNVVRWRRLLLYAYLHNLQFLNKMAATSHGVVAGMMHMYEVSCCLCAVKLDDKASRINVRGRSSCPIETELTKLPLKLKGKRRLNFRLQLGHKL